MRRLIACVIACITFGITAEAKTKSLEIKVFPPAPGTSGTFRIPMAKLGKVDYKATIVPTNLGTTCSVWSNDGVLVKFRCSSGRGTASKWMLCDKINNFKESLRGASLTMTVTCKLGE